MASILRWKAVPTASGSPVTITVTGNVDTRVVTRYFWLPNSDQVVDTRWDRDDGEALEFDLARVTQGTQNHLGFSCRAAPVVPSESHLFITFALRQGNTILEEVSYSLAVADPNTPVRLSDGITLKP